MSRPPISLGFIISSAGPSRATLTRRSLHTTCFRQAAPPPRPSAGAVRRKSPEVNFSHRSPAPSSRAPQPARLATPNTPSSALTWQPMKSRVKGVIAEERLIFARPFEDSTWGPTEYLLPVLTLGFCMSAVSFVGYKVYHWNDPIDERTYEGWFAGVSRKITDWVGPAGLLLLGSLVVSTGKRQFRCIVRLSEVRLRPVDSNSSQPERTFIRVQHGGHLLHSFMFPRYRDVPREAIKLYSLPDLKVRMDIVAPARPARGFLMWFGDSRALEESKDDVAVSLQRMYEAFGAIAPIPRELAEKEMDNWVFKQLDKLTGYDKKAKKSSSP